MAKTTKAQQEKNSMFGFTPYKPPVLRRLEERGGGPETPASSLMHRMAKKEVDAEVISVVAWALSFFEPRAATTSLWDLGASLTQRERRSGSQLMERIEEELLNDLGLCWEEDRMGGITLRPKLEFIQPETELPLWDVFKGKQFLGSTRAVGDIDAIQRYASWAKITAVGLTAKAAKR